ncbi:alkyl hydroperoxide reductase/ thiol specific antioxidant/ Mal allergen [Calothrix sp. NIES-4071]|nr:alkyl hydroperoxide reductase/ thiol specific antioxidant/ Mal allergen [Calothrix sp. NIES-4071]BAZ61606.1 alkyl hydroperoxide reductase/ thiol specific antioxidant/ Mal allergen [Calothrix sp. NIES-4105]
MGIERSTFLVSPDHKIAYTWTKVKTKGHAQAVLKQLQVLVS